MRARGILAASVLVVVALGLIAGCSKKLRPIQNLPPSTYLNIQGPVDTVNHRVHLYWYGTDPDGSISAYQFRWIYPDSQSPTPRDIAWITILPDHGRLRTDSVFTVATIGGPHYAVGDTVVVMPRFEIRAVDNLGLADPHPAVEDFNLRNTPPVVRFTNRLGPLDAAKTRWDSTYASVTVSWENTDPGSGGPGVHYRVWLDGSAAAYDSTAGQTYTVPSARFIQGGTYRSGFRTLFVQAVDDGGLLGRPDSMTWFVRAPAATLESNNQGRLLVIDEVPNTGANNYLFDAFYKSVADLLPAGTYSVLRPQFNPNMFRSGRDVAQTLRQFKAVLWYRGGELTISPLLTTYQDSIGAYLDSGGNLYLDGLYLVDGLRAPGALGVDFQRRYLGSDGLITRLDTRSQSLTAGWSSNRGSQFRFSHSGYDEVFSALVAPGLMAGDSVGALRGFAVTDTNSVAVWAMDGQLDPPNTGFEVAVGVSVRQSGNGRAVVLNMPVRFAAPAVATRLLRRMLSDFGIGITAP